MKKILLLLGLSLAFCNLKAQDTISAQDFTIYTNPSDTDYVWSFNGADDYRLNVTTFMPLRLSTTSILPKLSTYTLNIGTTTPQTTYKFNCIGTGYFSGDLLLNTRLRFNNASIWNTGNELYFNSVTAGTQSLSDLLSGATYSLRNGLKSTSGYTELGGSLMENTTIDIDNYTFNVGNGTTTYLELNDATGLSSLVSSNRLTLQSSDLTLYAVGSFRLYSTGVVCPTWYDYTTTPYGLNMPDWSTYYTNILADTVNGAVMTFGAVKAYVASSGLIGDDAIEDSAAVAESAINYIKVYNATLDSFDRFELETDTLTTITDSTVSVNVTSSKRIQVTDTEACAIFGFSGGVQGDVIDIANTTTNNLILKNNSTGTQKIQNGSDATITGYGGASLYCDGTMWIITSINQ
jgi:hypothetical protein